MGKTYISHFKLKGCVNDLEKARAYLAEEDMTKYLDEDIKPLVLKIYWELINLRRGYVIVEAKAELSEGIKARISEWIKGQNSDGLGEGFEQQDFAWISNSNDPNGGFMCSFDWETNNYELIEAEEIFETVLKDWFNERDRRKSIKQYK